MGLPPPAHLALRQALDTYAVRTGRRDSYGVQMYFCGEGLKSIAWQDGDFGGDIRCATGYVTAEGSIHPSGEEYECILGSPNDLAAVPEYVRRVPPDIRPGLGLPNAPVEDDGGKIDHHRNEHMVHLLGKARAAGMDVDALEAYAIETNEARCVPPLDEPELRRIVANICKYAIPDNGPAVVIGGKVAGVRAVMAEESVKEFDPWGKYHPTD